MCVNGTGFIRYENNRKHTHSGYIDRQQCINKAKK